MLQIKEMPNSERPREKGLKYGIRTLSTRELLAVLIRHGFRGQSALQTADLLLEKAKGVQGIARMSIAELAQIPGISRVKALELHACFELTRRTALEQVSDTDVIGNPEELVKWLQREIGSSLQEEFLVIYLSGACTVIKHAVLFKGTINQSNVYPREIFREALLVNSTNIMLVHNHPGGNLIPSRADVALTARLVRIGREMGIAVLDHLIVTQTDWVSFAQLGIMEECMTADRKEW